MKKWIINKLKNWLMPSPDDVTSMAVNAIVAFVNQSGKEEIIAKYGTAADEFTKVQAKITSWLRDGKIDEAEKAELYRALLPIAEKLIQEVKS